MQRIFLFVCSLVLLGIAVGVQDQRFEAELQKAGMRSDMPEVSYA